jgi:hypothetical protein
MHMLQRAVDAEAIFARCAMHVVSERIMRRGSVALQRYVVRQTDGKAAVRWARHAALQRGHAFPPSNVRYGPVPQIPRRHIRPTKLPRYAR